MINKNLIMRCLLAFFMLFCLVACKKKSIEIGKPENYTLTERDFSNDCNIYQMRFKDGKYIFKFSLAGSCKSLNTENYLKEYSMYLNLHQDSLVTRRGYIVLDYNGNDNDINVLKDSVINITKRYFKTFVSLSKVDETGFEIKVYDEKKLAH